MTTAFQSNAFQDSGFQIDGGAAAAASVVISGVKRRLRKYDKDKDKHLEALFPNLRDWHQEQKRERKERKKQLYAQTTPSVQLIEFPPMPGRAYVPIKYSPDEIRIDRNLDLIAKMADDEEDEELIKFLGALDG